MSDEEPAASPTEANMGEIKRRVIDKLAALFEDDTELTGGSYYKPETVPPYGLYVKPGFDDPIVEPAQPT